MNPANVIQRNNVTIQGNGEQVMMMAHGAMAATKTCGVLLHLLSEKNTKLFSLTMLAQENPIFRPMITKSTALCRGMRMTL